ncbi:16S rRNA (cytosine(1402)-N(4))-methyltransferase RsmH [Patescibacteria group bacterium]|nr:16S rRNA (cytosine(1402)-N(4))-methyltransferase RsmH [Patescibacteria group bacterium]MBU4274848.1 16S rRNA (cytosine(1402)-N(4))-methyltransferase RsmH [Patescibacteria group bacterium]MBU4367983.1 16S rRNA (cytosine(1402)-N(4))-methyltransferase RsmH [Patescibacteria group bacterium]MBU4462164.1 16S rRNA (cytosine(1402)-N(4))-methyltransferase RsmH [Patescibacteria group bacterium]MCG2699827.1 16S rRNA (cytosine(1402)-N(4))-methyltransferase RsmH [Candidatus Parcubacteria bacterium]
MHIPVFQKEVLKYLDPKPNENFIDCTIGHGGHVKNILEKTGPKGKVLGIDLDLEQIKICQSQLEAFKERIILVNSSYTNLKEIIEKNNFQPVHGILMDLGMSSWHLENSGRGFSFLKDEPLDMRYSARNYLTAREILNNWSQQEIERIIKEYSEEKFSRRISQKIVDSRKKEAIETTFDLVKIIHQALPLNYSKQKTHFATRTFQALRIVVNDELNNLKKVLPQIVEILEAGGRIAIISFHSLEDRIVKKFFREKGKEGIIKILTKKPITVSFQEININPRARSAKLRAAIKN